MNQEQIRRLEKNLTRSAKKAKKYWVRGMLGLVESDQGFFPVEDVPVSNPFNNEQNKLKDVLENSKVLIEDLANKNEETDERINSILNVIEEQEKQIQELFEINRDLSSKYEEILEKGIAEYIKVLANL